MSTSEDDIRRRRIQEAMQRGLQLPPFAKNVTNEPPAPSSLPSADVNAPRAVNPALSTPLPAPNVSIPPNAGLNVPPPGGPVSVTPPNPRVGYSTKGLTGLDALLERRKALEEADPESQVTSTGEILPPQKTGRFRGAAELAGIGAQDYDPNHPMLGLGRVLGGGVTGLISPRSGAKAQRKLEMGQLDNDIARGLKIQQGQAELGSLDALRRQREAEPAIQAEKIRQETEIQNAKLEIDRQKAAGEITKQQADQKNRDLDRQSREKIAGDRITSQEKIAGLRGGPNSEKQQERQAKSSAAQAEYDQLVKDEQTAGENKNKAYDYLEKVKQTAPDDEMGRMDIRQAQQAAENADKLYQSFGEKKRDAQTRARENAVSSPSNAPEGVSEDSIRADGKRRGKNDAQIKAAIDKARSLGWIK